MRGRNARLTCRRRENGRQDLKVELARKASMKSEQLWVVLLKP